ncbi:DUF3558 family protein [Nocardia sp. CDC160]|uniref:DUF3558 family protein n=1 Tax=Nocardia sp. CDC160 TaxID=3112166 RepID=UPI002DBC0D7D|nr:DUF3558 family protein [Nocardia sp. CDC160]MEC3920186.1 DUF3558 family protein [Nocardia sp. CDC160]
MSGIDVRGVIRSAAILLGALPVLVACGSDGSHSTTDSSSVLQTGVPSAFDPCRDIPDSTLQQLGFDSGSRKSIPDQVINTGDVDQVVRARGCEFAIDGGAGYQGPTRIAIEATNTTIAYFRKHDEKDRPVREISVEGRDVIISGPAFGGQCEGLIDVPGGGILLSTADTNATSCDMVVKTAKAIAPLLPK